MAQSWNVSLARQMGRAAGTEALQKGISGWYAPAVNLHRSPFGGRNYEYYSEDGLLSGEMCGNTAAGSLEAGEYCYVKHLVCNDQESGIYRDGIYTWMTEQTLRELYLAPFRRIVEQYHVTGLMTSYNRLGAVWAGGSSALLTNVLRKEWGFQGAVLTDYSDHHSYMNADQMLRAGGDLWMDGFSGDFQYETSSNTFRQALRRAVKNVLYMELSAHVTNREYSDTMRDRNLISPVIRKGFEWWKCAVAAIDILALLLFVLAVRKVRNKPGIRAVLRGLREKRRAWFGKKFGKKFRKKPGKKTEKKPGKKTGKKFGKKFRKEEGQYKNDGYDNKKD